MTIRAPVQPAYGTGAATVIAAAGTGTLALNSQAKQVILTNQGANVVYVRVGNGTVAATVADYPVPPNAQVVISKGDGDNVLAYNSPAGTTLHSMTGEGW